MKKYFITIVFLIISTGLSAEEDYKDLDIGFGGGGPYAFIGGNISTNPIYHLNIFLGLGAGPEGHPPAVTTNETEYKFRWSAGIRYNILSAQKSLRPRITLYYGTNSIIEQLRKSDDGKILGKFTTFGKGLSIGAGMSWMWFKEKNFGMDLDITYGLTIDSYLPKDEVDKYFPINKKNPVLISLGLRYAFNI